MSKAIVWFDEEDKKDEKDIFCKKYGFKTDLPQDFIPYLLDLSKKYGSQISIPLELQRESYNSNDLSNLAKQIVEKSNKLGLENKVLASAIIDLVIRGWVEFLFVYKELKSIVCDMPDGAKLQEMSDCNLRPFFKDLDIEIEPI